MFVANYKLAFFVDRVFGVGMLVKDAMQVLLGHHP